MSVGVSEKLLLNFTFVFSDLPSNFRSLCSFFFTHSNPLGLKFTFLSMKIMKTVTVTKTVYVVDSDTDLSPDAEEEDA
jgi:hypothetical protein